MADDDLLLTNNYTKNTSNGDSNKEVFSKLMNSKNTSQNVYNKDTPEFTKNLNPDQNIGVGINENSVAFEQFLKIAQTDKKKKIKKTIMNIDSRNRTKTYTFDSLNVKYTGDSPLSFVTNATEFELSIDSNAHSSSKLKTTNVNYIDDIKFFNQLILSNLNVNEFSKLGITKDSFEFSVTKGAPIFNILQFIYDEYDSNGKLTSEYNSFDNSKQKYRYNRLVLNLPSNIEPKELQTMRLGKDVDINIITNVNISYPTPSHYFINLGRTFSNVYSVSLISSEIPNTSYTFNENLVESNFGQFKLTTKQNNKLRWINKTDRVNVATNSLHMATLFHENMPVLPSVPASKLHNDHFKKIVNLYNCNLKSISYDTPNVSSNFVKAASNTNISIISLIQTKTIDDVPIVDDKDYFILKHQTNTQENGLYKKTSLGVEKIVTNDFIESNDISFIFFVSNGVTNKGKYFLINEDGGVFSFTEIDYVENLRRLHSLIRVSQDLTSSSSPSIIPLKSRDYYFNSRYLGNFVFNNNNIIGIKQNTISNISDTVFTSNESMISNIEKDLNGFYTYKAVVNKSGHLNDNTYSHIKKFTDFKQFTLELYSANTNKNINDYVAKTFMNLELPFKIIFQNRYKESGDNSFITYIFNVTKISEITPPTSDDSDDDGRLIKQYRFDIVPINSNITTDISPFNSVTDGDIQFTIYNSIPHNIIFNYQKYYPDIWDKLQSYYITSEVGLIKSVPQLSDHFVQLSYSALDNSSKDAPIPEVTEGSPSPHIMKYLLEFKTYYSYNFVNTVLNKQVETVQVGGVEGGYYLFIFFKDANADTVSEISSVAKDYSYVKVNNNFYQLGSDITYNISTNKFKIQIIPVNGISNIDIISDVTTTVTVSFQRLNFKELKYVYIKSADQHQDLSNKIVRFNLKDKEDYNFIEYYFSGKVETTTVGSFNVHKYEVRYKFKPELSTINLLDYEKKKLTLFDEKNRTYMRNYIGNFIVTKYDNDNTDNHDSLILSDQIEVAYSGSNDDIVYNSTGNSTKFLEYFEDNIKNKKLETDIIDIPSYQVIAITNKSVKNGISSISFAKEFIETEEQTALIVNPKINSDTNKLPSQLNMSLNNTSYKAIDNRTATKYPVYELNISSGKYSADSIVKYMLGALNNLKSRVYDYSKGIFYNDSSFQKFIDLNNEFGINQESKFVIEVDKSVNSISFKQYKKIFDSHKNTSVIKGQIVYYNEGFPFVYFNIPQVSLPNNSLVYMAGGGSIGNMGGDVTRGESNVVVPLNFRVRIRQLLPLPKIDSVNSNANLFAKEGYADVEDNEIYNKFVDYINNAVKSDNVKDISTDYIVDQIFGLNESGYIDLNNLSEDKLTNLKEQFTSKGLPKNSANMTESELNKSFVDNYGKNIKYKSVQNFNNQSENTFSYNRTGLEYYGQALINGYKNEQSYREYFDAEKEPEDYETYGDDVSSGFETTFIQNELFMRLSDTNVTNKKNIIGRFTKVSEQSDKYGNIVGDYDLFSDNYLNFKIGDIIIGLDSNTIGVILPYDYKYNSLPNNDLVALGAGAYLMNKSVMDAGSAFEKYVSVTDSSKGTRELAKKFISNINNWQIERNKTNRGFYVYSSTTPNSSKLGGSKLPNFQLYVPRFFKFLEDTDTALDKFGLKNKENNSKFNYFKTNYEPNHEVSIKRSFFNIAKNNEIFTDYLIFETKSTDNFSVNDRVYIEDHSIISKGADFKREKFFNVELLENYASFISKLETIYNTTVQNYNGLSGIGKTSSDDETYLYDNEYKYDDASGNSTARGTVTLEAELTKFVINDPGRGYTGSPLITIDNTFQGTDAGTAIADIIKKTGALNNASVINRGKYSSIPKIIIENPSITASLSTNTGVLGQIDLVNINDPGFGYTQVPIITAPASSGIQSIGLIELSGIGSVDFQGKDDLKNLYEVPADVLEKSLIPSPQPQQPQVSGRIDIIFSDPSAGTSADAAEGYIEYEVTDNGLSKKITSIIITKSGSKYSPIERISMFRVINWHPILTKSNKLQYFEPSSAIGTNFNVIVNAIGNVVISTGGTKYYINDVYSSVDESQQSGNVFIDNNISNAIVKCEGNPNITILDPSESGSGAILTPIIANGVITSIQVVHGGSGYSNLTTLTIDVPRALFKSSLTTTGRINNVSVLYSPSGYNNSTTLTVTNPKETALGTINYLSTPPLNHELITINNKGKGYLDGDTSSEISGFNGVITTTISKGEIQRIELELNNYEFAVNESPLIVIPNSNNDDFATLSVYKSDVGQIIMKRKYHDELDTYNIINVLDLKKNTDPTEEAKAKAILGSEDYEDEKGVVKSIQLDPDGSGYNKESPPAIIIAPPFITATAIATVSQEGVISDIVLEGGIGYKVLPGITIAAPDGFGTENAATATAKINGNGVVTDIVLSPDSPVYTSIPEVTIAPPFETATASAPATATATVNEGVITGIADLYGGTGYTEAPLVTIESESGGTGAQATAEIDVNTGVVDGINITNPGTGYTGTATISITAPKIRATATATVSEGVITEIVLAQGGTGYTEAPLVTIESESGEGAQATATIDENGVVNGIVVAEGDGGSEYIDTTTNIIVAPPNIQATATAKIDENTGVVDSITIKEKGAGYIGLPKVTIAPPFVKATASASLTKGEITKINIINPGAGYVTPPEIQIDAPNIQATVKATVTEGEVVIDKNSIDGGAGYTSKPNVTIEDPPGGNGSNARATATVSGGVVTNIEVTIGAGGVGYSTDNPPIVTIDPPTNITATVRATVNEDGKVQIDTNNINGGGGYHYPPQITIDNDNSNFYDKLGLVSGPPTDIPNKIHKIEINTNTWGTRDPFKFTSPPDIYVYKLTSAQNTDTTLIPAARGILEQNNKLYIQSSIPEVVTVKAVIENGTVLKCVPDQTKNKISSDSVVVFNSPARQAELSAEIEGKVKSISIDNSGNNYDKTNLPGIDIDPPNITAKAISVVDSGGTITRIDITNPGAGYSSSMLPVITVASPTEASSTNTGTSATAKANVVNGNIISINIETAGSGYTRNSPPSVTIGPPARPTATATAVVNNAKVTDIKITYSGARYSSSTPPNITIDPPPNTTASATATVNEGVITGIADLYGGTGYTEAPLVTIESESGGTGAQATAEIDVNTGVVDGINITNPGTGYTGTATISITAPKIRATATATVIEGVITEIVLAQGGTGYTEAPLVTIESESGEGALATATIDGNGVVNGIVVAEGDGGSGYIDTTTNIIVAPPNIQATATATIDGNGVVDGINIEAEGAGYIGLPEVTIESPFIQASVTATVTEDGGVGINITNPGSCYLAAPLITIDPPPNTRASAIATVNGHSKVEITSFDGGAGYTKAPSVTIESESGGTGALATATIDGNGVVDGITLNPGTGYTGTATISITAPKIRATATATVIEGVITGINITNAGTGYTEAPLVTIESESGGTGALATATIDENGVVNSITLNPNGSGYNGPVTISITAPNIQATATAEVDTNGVVSIASSNEGAGYIVLPKVTIQSPQNREGIPISQATVTSSIDNGRITNLDVGLPGAGYTNIPKLKVNDPPKIAKLPIPFKNKQIYRYFNQDIINFNKNYYLIYKTSQTSPPGLAAGQFHISLNDKIINQLYIETAFDFIKTDLSIGDIRNNMCVITITNDSNEKKTFTRSDIKNNFTSSSSITAGFFSNNSKYHLNIKAYRVPIAVSETANFGDKSSDGSHKTQYISKYSTLGIFQRLLDEQINNIYNNMNYNIIKAAELYRTYSYNIFKNRIIKIKVCPIDEQGFSFENCNSTGTVAQETLVSNRQVKGYSKKLFPYHEYDVIKSYDKSEFGRDVNIIGTAYKGFRRPQQHFNNKETTSKAFLPGMGVYVIKNESITNGTQINNTHYNSTATAKNIDLYYSEYKYDTQFMGFVLGTSINSRQEYNRNYRMHSDNFSKLDASDSVHSEYYIYMLIDPDATTTEQIDELFNTLNTDNVNIVFDANARTDYTDTALTQSGYVTSRNEFYINSSKNDHKTKSDDKQYSIPKNIYKQRCFMNEQNILKFFEDETYDTEITPANVDAFLGLTAPSITINKPKLNKTLPYYNFQTRLACATIVARPVAYEKKNDTYSRKLFNSGDYDYFYKHYLENKTVMRYKAMQETRNIDNMNKHNMVVENPSNRNFKANNFKETDCHSSCLDPNINSTENFFDVGNINNVTEVPEGNKQILKFNNGEDIILVDAYKRKFSYESGDVDYSDIQGRGDQKLGIQHTHIKILTASVIPPLFFNHNRLLDNKLNEYCNHVSILDHQYDSGIERLTYNNIVGKYKPDKIHIVGDNSNQYSGTDVDDMTIYNKIFVTDTSVSNQITISSTIGIATTIDSTNKNDLKDCIMVLNTNIKCKNESQPIDDTNNTEMVLIKSAELLTGTDEVKLTLTHQLTKVHKTNIEEEMGRSFIPYSTVKTSSALVYNNSSSSYSFEVSSSENHYSTLKEDDYILIDWGVQRDVIHSGTIPYKLATNNSPNKTTLYTTATYKITKITEDKSVNPHIKTVTIQNPRVLYPSGIRIIIMKNPFNTANNSTISNNFLSTQPFTINNEWYTRIFYKGASYNIGSHFDGSYKTNNVLPNLDGNYIRGGTPLFNKNYSNNIYIGGMKGIKLPFLDINGSTTFSDTYSIPPEDDFYEITPSLRDDYMTENNSSPVINNIQGEFTTRFNNINNISDFDNNPDINSINEAQWIDNKETETEYASIVIKGLYLGYGGFMEDRANEDTINTIINKSSGTAIKKIKQINNKFFIYIQLSKTYNNFFLASNLDESYNLINQSTRKTYLDYETNLHLLDEILETQPEDYEPYLSIFGKNGKMVRKIIKTPYDLNPNNYIYMVIPNLNHIKSVQNNEIEDAFAKILLPGESNKTLFSSFVAGTKIFYNNLFNNLNELEITFITNEGHLFDFNGSEHSFAIEITEIIDKLEYINPRFGNIEF